MKTTSRRGWVNRVSCQARGRGSDFARGPGVGPPPSAPAHPGRTWPGSQPTPAIPLTMVLTSFVCQSTPLGRAWTEGPHWHSSLLREGVRSFVYSKYPFRPRVDRGGPIRFAGIRRGVTKRRRARRQGEEVQREREKIRRRARDREMSRPYGRDTYTTLYSLITTIIP